MRAAARLVVCVSFACAAAAAAQVLETPYFVARTPPSAPEAFAPAVLARLGIHSTPRFAKQGTEVYWSAPAGRGRAFLVSSRLDNGRWSEPRPLPFSTGDFFDHNPAPSPDGRRVVFASNRPIPGKAATTLPGTDLPTSDLWMVERTPTGWSAPSALGPSINTEWDDDVPVLTGDGSLYFGSSRPGAAGPAAVYRSGWTGTRFGPAEALPAPVTSAAGEMLNDAALDESWVIYLSFAAGDAGGLRIAFKDAAGTWTPSMRLPDAVQALRAYGVAATGDGRALIFTARGPSGPTVHWMTAAGVLRRPAPRD